MQTIRSDTNAKIKGILNDDQKKQSEQDQLRMQGQSVGSKRWHATTVTSSQCGPAMPFCQFSAGLASTK
jgi:hypothetical protein